MSFKVRLFHPILLVFLALCGLTPAASQGSGIDTKAMDTSVDACKNFYQFTNGKWLAGNPIPADRSSWGAGSQVYENNLIVLHQILDEVSKDSGAAKGSIRQKVGALYSLGMDEAKIEAEDLKSLEPEFQRIANIKDPAALVDTIAYLHTTNTFPAFAMFVEQDFKDSTRYIAWLYQGGLGLPDRDYYFSEDPKMTEIRKEYVLHIAKMLQFLGDSEQDAAKKAKTIMDMETRLAKASMTVVEQRDPSAIYHKMTLSDLQKVAPEIDWKRYFTAIGLTDPGEMNVAQPEFFKELNNMVTSVPMNDWHDYLKWQLIHDAAPLLSSRFVNEDFRFNSGVIRGTKELRPRWKRVLETTDQLLGEALGQRYVERAFPPEAKARALVMVQNLKAALGDRLATLDWVSEETRKQGLRKLNAIAIKVGYPDKWRDYSSLPLDQDSYVRNVAQASQFEFRRKLGQIGKPIDRGEWGMTPPTVNAYYNPTMNEIVFPAGILQPPFFDANADDESNYGGIGTVIGHELTHGFDDQGRQFDAEGNLKNWWTAEDEKMFNSRAAIIEKQYNAYQAIDNTHVNGKLTLGENIADIGGLKIGYLAFLKAMQGKSTEEKINGYTPLQRFFISYGQIWRRNTRPEAVRLMIATDPHSPPQFRVLGPLANMPEFSKAFACKDSMASGSSGASTQIW